jgi:hypothetical protein
VAADANVPAIPADAAVAVAKTSAVALAAAASVFGY